jgi:cytochrome c peroxidase
MLKRLKQSSKVLMVALLLLSILYLSCTKEPAEQALNPNLMAIPKGFPQMPFPDDNSFSKKRWQLGKKLFYDTKLSSDGTVSCASCHKAHLAFADDRAFSPGVHNRPGVRNAPSLANIGYHPYFLREGSVPTLEMQAAVPVQEANEFDHNIVSLTQLLQDDESYRTLAQEAYQRDLNPFTFTRALATFQRSLISGSSSFDQYFYQDKTHALSESEKRGMTLFFSAKTNCSTCHQGFNFTNYAFKNNGLAEQYADEGRRRATGLASDEALFKTPSLRNVEVTAPYMHNGALTTLQEVIQHYNTGGKNHPNKSTLIRPLNLNKTEQQDLLAFLRSLTDYSFISNQELAE